MRTQPADASYRTCDLPRLINRHRVGLRSNGTATRPHFIRSSSLLINTKATVYMILSPPTQNNGPAERSAGPFLVHSR